MVASNMVVRRLLSVPNWDPAERKLTTGGCLLIPRGMQFGPELFPDLVMLCNHAAPLIDSSHGRRFHFGWWDLSEPWIQFFPVSQGDLELFTAEEVAKLKELGVLNPPNAPGCLPLFPPLVSSSRGKVVSTMLGVPPPSLDTHGIGQSLVTDQDEESILSDSYSDHHSNTLDSSIMWGKHTMCTAQIKNRNHRPPSAKTKMDTGLVTRTMTKIMTGNA